MKKDDFQKLWLGLCHDIKQNATPKKTIQHSKTLDAENRFTINCIAHDSILTIIKN